MLNKRFYKRKMALFFTEGVSLRVWHKAGNLEREIPFYSRLANHLGEIYFFTYGGKDDLDYIDKIEPNIRVMPNKWRIPSLIYSILLPFIYWRILKDVELLKTNQMRGSWTAVIAKYLFRKRLIIRCGYQWSINAKKGGLPGRMQAYLSEKLAYRVADKIIVTTEDAKQYEMQRYHICGDRISVIPNHIDTDIFKPSENTPKAHHRIAFVGRLSRVKNLFSLLEAIKGLNMELVIIGHGELLDELRKKALEDGTKVIFKGHIHNFKVPGDLNRCELFILPSYHEGSPKALLEAMACGLPVIGTDVTGINSIIRHKHNGFLCDISSHAIREAITAVIQDEKLKIRMGKNARQFIVQNHSSDVLLKREIKLIEELI